MPINSFLYPGVKVPPVFEVANSLRFERTSTDYLVRTPSGAGNRRTFTFSTWLKRADLDQNLTIFASGTASNNQTKCRFVDSDNSIFFDNEASGSSNMRFYTTRLFRDVSAWYHIVIAVDTTQATDTNRVKIYVNGSQETSFSTANYPAQNLELFVNATNEFRIGREMGGGNFDGYLAETVLIDGLQLDPTSFGETDEDTGIWKPIDVSGLTFGTNGFYLDFENSGSLGADVSGNGNNFTANNLTSVDQSTDTCTNNFTTLNSLANLTGSPTFSEANLKVAGDNSANHNWQTTFVVSSGKWYWELKDLTSSPDGSLLFYDQSISSGSHPGFGFVLNTKKKVINGSVTGSAIGSSAQNDIWSMALDLDNGKMFIARNGTYLESGDPANGTNPFIQTSDGLPSEGVFGGHVYNGSMELNFGSPSFSISSGNSDGNGYGNFEYSVPSGYHALNTKNLAEYG